MRQTQADNPPAKKEHEPIRVTVDFSHDSFQRSIEMVRNDGEDTLPPGTRTVECMFKMPNHNEGGSLSKEDYAQLASAIVGLNIRSIVNCILKSADKVEEKILKGEGVLEQ